MKNREITIEEVPYYRRVPNTKFVVDFFVHKVIDCTNSFLTHFHSDHYYGLKKSYNLNIYCSETTSNLIHTVMKIDRKYLIPLEIQQIYEIERTRVMCYEANHCPGAVGFIFCVNTQIFLHTGDFRFNKNVHFNLNDLIGKFNLDSKDFYDIVFCDNTYENYQDFDTQFTVIRSVITEMIKTMFPINKLAPIPTKFIFFSYFIGKEKLFLSVAYFFQMKVNLQPKKYKALECLSEYSKRILNNSIKEFCIELDQNLNITTRINISNSKSFRKYDILNGSKKLKKNPLELICINNDDSIIDVLPFNYITRIKINELYGNKKYKKIIIICGTGWSKKKRYFHFQKINGTIIKNGIEILQYPYSEHSSSTELIEFRKFIKTNKIIPTVKL